MKKLPLPLHDDVAALESLANDDSLDSYPELLNALDQIKEAYAHYLANNGNAFQINGVLLPASLDKHLKSFYDSPRAAVRFITNTRETTEVRTCSMCGSLLGGSLDHVLPKKRNGIYSVFAPNLVPACKCNSKRKEVVFGEAPGERILHPYFDDCLSDRIVSARFLNPGPVPTAELILLTSPIDPNYPAISFHFKQIIEKSALKRFLLERWSDLWRRPKYVVRALGRPIATPEELQQILVEEREDLDEQHRTKNSWYSVFISALLDPGVSTWLLGKIASPGYRPNDPLGPI